jgi:hypothetical protein
MEIHRPISSEKPQQRLQHSSFLDTWGQSYLKICHKTDLKIILRSDLLHRIWNFMKQLDDESYDKF